jgi:hypothetical protein
MVQDPSVETQVNILQKKMSSSTYQNHVHQIFIWKTDAAPDPGKNKKEDENKLSEDEN